jgi:hypothetical protein
MQVNSTLIAAQQAAREAQERFRAAHLAPPQGNFAATLEKTEGSAGKFSALPLKQLAPAPQSEPAARQQATARLGTVLDIKI